MSYFSRDKGFQSSKCYSNKSYKTREDSGVFCTHCKTSKEDLQSQITQLKDKAHQSFMQVLQIQQLHDEELTLIREQFDQKESQYSTEIDKLKKQNECLKAEMLLLEKNTRRHSCDFGNNEFQIDNIDAILCEDGEISYLDESQLIQFKDFINIRNGNDYIANLRREIYKDIKFVSNNKTQIQKLFILIKELKDQNTVIIQKNEQISRKLSIAQTQLKSSKHTSQSINHEIKFMSEQIKRLGNEKLRLQKKICELQRNTSCINDKNEPKVKIQTHLSRQPRINIKSLSPNFRAEALEREKHIGSFGISEESEFLSAKKQVSQLNYAKFMCTDSIQMDTELKKRNSESIKKMKKK